MAKKVKTTLKLNIQAGEANPAPPIGPALGQHGIAIMDFCKQYNEQTKDKKGELIPAVITIYEDRTFSFELKLPPITEMIKKELGLEKGSQEPGRKVVKTISQAQLEKIAQAKMPDMNTTNLEQAVKIVSGSIRSMGIEIK
ncbi:50S ribosomal protein L11 [Patescibacteria group bacterium]|nr:50S ribosomal protein L11 [Patescibacteria group bacterium]MBU1931809.1 50S ribosomal protein L11 [Patescibacteria group bacterium]